MTKHTAFVRENRHLLHAAAPEVTDTPMAQAGRLGDLPGGDKMCQLPDFYQRHGLRKLPLPFRQGLSVLDEVLEQTQGRGVDLAFDSNRRRNAGDDLAGACARRRGGLHQKCIRTTSAVPLHIFKFSAHVRSPAAGGGCCRGAPP
jgi:hypothetical protein